MTMPTTSPFGHRSAISLAFGLLALQAAAQTLPEVRVDASAESESATSPVVGYRAKNAVTATKTDTPLAETPQAVTVVTRDQLVDQGATSLQDALGYAAGVRYDAYGLDARTDSVRIRGSEPSVYLDGLRQAYGYYTSTTRTEPYALERLEVLRGPAGMLFGSGTAAGVLNMVSKRPLTETQREVGVQFGNWGYRMGVKKYYVNSACQVTSSYVGTVTRMPSANSWGYRYWETAT